MCWTGESAAEFLQSLQPLFSTFCHRNLARSYPLADGSVLLCARCTGLYAGAFAGTCSALLWKLLRRSPSVGSAGPLFLAAILATPLEVLGEIGGLWPGTPPVRLALGLLTGSALTCAIMIGMGGGAAAPAVEGRRWLPAIPLLIDGLLLPMVLAPHRWGTLGKMVGGIVLLLGFLALAAGPVAFLIVRVKRYFSTVPLSEGSPS